MAYDKRIGLFEVNGKAFPLKYIKEKSYKVTPNSRTDMDSGVSTANGILVRTVLPHYRNKIEFETRPMDSDEFEDCLAHIMRYTNPQEKKTSLRYLQLETMTYETGEFYVPDYTPQIDSIDETTGKLKMASCRFAFIEY